MVGGELITDVRKPEIMKWRHCRRRAIYWLLRSPSQTCHAKTQNSNQQALDATSFFPVGGMPTARSLAWKTSLRKVRTSALQQIKERGALPMIDRGDILSGNRPLQQYLGFTAGRWLWSSDSNADSLIAPEVANGWRDWCMSRVTAIISGSVICIIVCLSWAVNHYRDNGYL